MFQAFGVRLGHLREALDLASELMAQTGHSPTLRERGIVQWKGKKNSDHHCEICFRSYISSLYWLGYIEAYACDCSERWAFKEIISRFEKAMRQRGWLEALQRRLFDSVGVA